MKVVVPSQRFAWGDGPSALVDIDFVPHELLFVLVGDGLFKEKSFAPGKFCRDHVEDHGTHCLAVGTDWPGENFGGQFSRELAAPFESRVLKDGRKEADGAGIARYRDNGFIHALYIS